MLRLLILLALVFAAVLLVRRWLRNMKVGVDKLDSNQNVPTVRCEHCGLFLPQAQAWTEAERFYCCRDHAKLASDRKGS